MELEDDSLEIIEDFVINVSHGIFDNLEYETELYKIEGKFTDNGEKILELIYTDEHQNEMSISIPLSSLLKQPLKEQVAIVQEFFMFSQLKIEELQEEFSEVTPESFIAQ